MLKEQQQERIASLHEDIAMRQHQAEVLQTHTTDVGKLLLILQSAIASPHLTSEDDLVGQPVCSVTGSGQQTQSTRGRILDIRTGQKLVRLSFKHLSLIRASVQLIPRLRDSFSLPSNLIAGF